MNLYIDLKILFCNSFNLHINLKNWLFIKFTFKYTEVNWNPYKVILNILNMVSSSSLHSCTFGPFSSSPSRFFLLNWEFSISWLRNWWVTVTVSLYISSSSSLDCSISSIQFNYLIIFSIHADLGSIMKNNCQNVIINTKLANSDNYVLHLIRFWKIHCQKIGINELIYTFILSQV
jgi:hypothetical protein